MIVDMEKLLSRDEFRDVEPNVLKQKIKAAEGLIRKYTNNDFQNRMIRFAGESQGNKILGFSPFLKAGDEIQITQSQVNDGLYTVMKIGDGAVQIDSELFSVPYNVVTKVEYPADVQEGVINLLVWEIKNRKKVGIKSETLSRHSVTYFDLDANNQVMGYPVSLLGFLKPYKKARF